MESVLAGDPRYPARVDASLGAASRALSAFDPLFALKLVALRREPMAIALRGIAMAQLGELRSSRKLLTRAARAFGHDEPVARARCVAAEAEVALEARDLATAARGLDSAARTLEAHGDRRNASFVRLQQVRLLLLLGKVEAAAETLSSIDLRGAPAVLIAMAQLAKADLALRGLKTADARRALARAASAARLAKVQALYREVIRAQSDLDKPAARISSISGAGLVTLEEVEQVFRSGDLVIDACRRRVRQASVSVSLLTRPVLLGLAVALGERAPHEVQRSVLIERAFGGRTSSESMRARLRVEVGRLRKLLSRFAQIEATPGGFSMKPRGSVRVSVLLPPDSDAASALSALLRGGEAWSTSALATALGRSQRTVQRALSTMLEAGRVDASGAGRARRWVAPPPAGFVATLALTTRDGDG